MTSLPYGPALPATAPCTQHTIYNHTIPTTFKFTHSPWQDLDAYVLTPDASLPTHLQFCPFPTSTTKCLPSRQRELVAHCITPVAEKIVSAEGVDIARWLSVYHLIPRLLLLSSLHKRMNINTPSACHPPSSTFMTPSRGRRVGAPRDLAGDAFETRVRAFLNGRFFELLSSTLDLTIAPNSPQNQSHYPLDPPPPTRSLRSRALEVRDLVRVGELSRAVTRADAAQLANHSASTISSLAQLHPDAPHPSDTPAPRTDILPPPLALKPPATPLCDPLIISLLCLRSCHSRPQQTMVGGAMNTSSGPSLSTQGETDLLMLKTPLILLHPLSQVAVPGL